MAGKYQKILLIDDDKIANYAHTRLLETLAIADEVVARDSAEEGLKYLDNALLEKRLPNIIFLDLHMPGMNGFDFLRAYDERCRNNQELSDACKVIVLTSSIDSNDVENAITNRYVKGFLNKPLSKESIARLT